MTRRSYNVAKAEDGDIVTLNGSRARHRWILRLITFFITCAAIVALCSLFWRVADEKTGFAGRNHTKQQRSEALRNGRIAPTTAGSTNEVEVVTTPSTRADSDGYVSVKQTATTSRSTDINLAATSENRENMKVTFTTLGASTSSGQEHHDVTEKSVHFSLTTDQKESMTVPNQTETTAHKTPGEWIEETMLISTETAAPENSSEKIDETTPISMVTTSFGTPSDWADEATPISIETTTVENLRNWTDETTPISMEATTFENSSDWMDETTPISIETTTFENTNDWTDETTLTLMETTASENSNEKIDDTTPISIETSTSENSSDWTAETTPTSMETTTFENSSDWTDETTPISMETTASENSSEWTVETTPISIQTSTLATLSENSNQLTLNAANKRVIGKMLQQYRTDSSDSCGQFYEYACGHFTDSDTILQDYLAQKISKKILDQAERSRNSETSTNFLRYYESCLNYENVIPEDERINLAEAAIAEIGKFFTENDVEVDSVDLTGMIADLLLRGSASLFDIVPELDIDVRKECHKSTKAPRFVLKLSPPTLESMLFVNRTDSCYEKQKPALREKEVNLRDRYEEYNVCTTETNDVHDSVMFAVEKFPAFAKYIDDVSVGVRDILDKFQGVANRNAIRRDQTRREYVHEDIVPDLDLDGSSSLNWDRLLRTLTNSTNELSGKRLITYVSYDFERFAENFAQTDESSAVNDKIKLNNALLGLYARKIYFEMVAPGRDETYCMRLATKLLEREASRLYMSSFDADELEVMTKTVTNTFDDLKRTLVSEVENAEWSKYTKGTEIMEKIKNLTVEVPDASYYRHDHPPNPVNDDVEMRLTGNFFNDTKTLQKLRRESMYQILNKSPNDYGQIWTHFSLPYETSGSVVHGLNKIIVPFGSVDWVALKNSNVKSSPHLLLATLGTRIAHEIAHHFDSTGIKYSFQTTTKNNLFNCDNNTLEQYYNGAMKNQTSFLVGEKERRVFLPSTGQTIRYEIPELALDEFVTDRVGLQLTYNTMLRLRSDRIDFRSLLTTEDLNEDQEFFLAYSQMYCTNVPLTSDFVSLYENENLPNRLRLSAIESSIKVWRDAWNCGNDDAPKLPSIFPNLTVVEQQAPKALR